MSVFFSRLYWVSTVVTGSGWWTLTRKWRLLSRPPFWGKTPVFSIFRENLAQGKRAIPKECKAMIKIIIYFDFCCCYEQVSPDQGSGGARLLRGSRVQAERIPVRLQWWRSHCCKTAGDNSIIIFALFYIFLDFKSNFYLISIHSYTNKKKPFYLQVVHLQLNWSKICRLLESIRDCGWEVLASIDISRKMNDKRYFSLISLFKRKIRGQSSKTFRRLTLPTWLSKAPT